MITSKTACFLLISAYIPLSSFAFAEDEKITFTEKQFEQCKFLGGLIALKKFGHQSAKAKGAPHIAEHRRLYEEARKLKEDLNSVERQLDIYPDPVPEEQWDNYKDKVADYKVLRARRTELYKQGDIKYSDYEKFKPEIDKRSEALQVAYDKYNKADCSKSSTTSTAIIDKHCPSSSKNIFCKSWY